MEGARTSRRVSSVKESKLALLARLREAKEKGERLRIEKNEQPVYETVDEAEYAELVKKRLEDDWIVDDEGGDYAEDGREIFDDNDEDEEASDVRLKTKSKAPSQSAHKKRLNPDIRASNSIPLHPVSRDIRSLFASSSGTNCSKKRKETNNLSVDPNLDDLLAELESSITEPEPRHRNFDSLSRKALVASKRNSVLNTNVINKPRCSPERSEHPTNISIVPRPRYPVVSEINHSSPISTNQRPRNPFSCRKHIETEGKIEQSKPQTNKAISFSLEEEASVASEMDVTDFSDDFEVETSLPKQTRPPIPEPKPTDELNIKPITSVTANWLAAENLAKADDATWIDETNPASFPSSLSKGNILYFYWIDAYEDFKQLPGIVYLFGKLYDHSKFGTYTSCCLRIKDLERRIFLLPRASSLENGELITVKNVYMEFRDMTAQYKIGKFRCKTTEKRYAFEFADVPEKSDYLEVRYAASFPALPENLQGKTFSRVFGTNTSFLENLILELQLRGPCWLEIKDASQVQPQISWCQVDYEVTWKSGSGCPIVKLSTVIENKKSSDDTSDLMKVPPAPPLCLAAINIKSVTQKHSSHSEIVSIGLLIDNSYLLDRPIEKSLFQTHYLVLAPPKDAALPYDLRTKLPNYGAQYSPPSSTWLSSNPEISSSPSIDKHKNRPNVDSSAAGGVDVESNERALLGRFLTRLHKLDPDLIVGHDLWGYQIELLIQRLNANKVPHWHRVGRLRRSANFPVNLSSRSWFIRHSMPGRLVCDTKVSARELVRSRTYNLSDLASEVLGEVTSKKDDKSLRGSVHTKRQVPSILINRLNGNGLSVHENDLSVMGFATELADMEIDSADLRCLFSNSDLVRQLIDFCLSDAHLVLRLCHQLQVLPLAMQITSICGNVLSRTLSGGRAERNESLLLHAFTQHGYIVPDPPVFRRGAHNNRHDDWDGIQEQPVEEAATGRRKPAYTGGLVLEPKKGFYDKYILLLDFNSLYPSIIQEFNICFTTVDRDLVATTSSDKEILGLDTIVATLLATVHGDPGAIKSNDIKFRLPIDQDSGLLPTEIRRLVESRKEVKKLLANTSSGDAAQRAQWNTRQAALKLTANSVYGCLGFSASRFCARGLAALVTGLGRAVLMNTRDLVENMNMEVIYGDTDSIMVNTNTTDLLAALAIGEKIRQEVNKRYRLLELDTDGVYASMLLLAKKKYAALSIINPIQWATATKLANSQGLLPQSVSTKQEMKGLDIVRRDWSALAVSVGRRCVAALLSGEPKDVILNRIHADLMETAEKVREGKLPISDFIITKMLTKNPEDYTDTKSQPHVQVALRLNSYTAEDKKTGTRRFRSGDTVEYIICEDGSGQLATHRGYSPMELTSHLCKTSNDSEPSTKGNLSVDVNYYLAHQIHPVVSRLVAPIEGTSPARIADCLGLDPSGYRRSNVTTVGDEDDENNPDSGFSSGFSNFTTAVNCGDVEPLYIKCPRNCDGPLIAIKTSAFSVVGKTWFCPTCSHNLLLSQDSTRLVTNRLVFEARRFIVRYELGWMTCEDPACAIVTRSLHCPPSSGHTVGESDSLWARGGRPLCALCGGQAVLKSNYSEAKLYKQLCFFRYLVSPPNVKHSGSSADIEVTLPPVVSNVLSQCRNHFDRLLSHSAFAMVDLGKLFSGLRTNSAGSGSY
ncbi:DNA polymerase alpha catalytic subunit [Schistosoma japonicum]|uniref:DNA polymerase n=1 Tax=Schistosoma japonicum TaxID=6182 RepID=A0A4Z2DCE6_SCHJA|nr:DNA polymerase alpha catalytic subunit [Schistosoma japonicum]